MDDCNPHTIGKDTSLVVIETHCVALSSSSPCFRHAFAIGSAIAVLMYSAKMNCKNRFAVYGTGKAGIAGRMYEQSGRGIEPTHTATVICTSGG